MDAGGALRCSSSSRGISCTDHRSAASFTIGDYKVIVSNPERAALGVPLVYAGHFTSVDRLQRCNAS